MRNKELSDTKKIAIDLRVLQIGHQYRGIGAHLMALLNNFNDLQEAGRHKFFFYINENQDNPLDILDIDVSNLDYDLIKVCRPEPGGSWKRKLQKAAIKSLDLLVKKDIGLPRLREMDVFLQLDFNLGLPSKRKVKGVLVAYDLIPWVMAENYLPNYRQNRAKGVSKKHAFVGLLNRLMYKFMMRSSVHRAAKILAISEYTRKDFIRLLGVKPSKIETVLLAGVSAEKVSKLTAKPIVKGLVYDFFNNSIELSLDLANNDFVFWLGGADRRRRLEDLVDAFNKVNASGRDIKLLLAGFDFKSLDSLVTDNISKAAISASSYRRNIYFLGHITNIEKEYLYKNAIACVLPSTYEGFGITVLESMNYDCPVITYKNTSIAEVGGDAALYADGSVGIEKLIVKILEGDEEFKSRMSEKAKKQLAKFDWRETAEETLRIILQ
jgi:glycosyltransferase involved in cell wall biosynthesis